MSLGGSSAAGLRSSTQLNKVAIFAEVLSRRRQKGACPFLKSSCKAGIPQVLAKQESCKIATSLCWEIFAYLRSKSILAMTMLWAACFDSEALPKNRKFQRVFEENPGFSQVRRALRAPNYSKKGRFTGFKPPLFLKKRGPENTWVWILLLAVFVIAR